MADEFGKESVTFVFLWKSQSDLIDYDDLNFFRREKLDKNSALVAW